MFASGEKRFHHEEKPQPPVIQMAWATHKSNKGNLSGFGEGCKILLACIHYHAFKQSSSAHKLPRITQKLI